MPTQNIKIVIWLAYFGISSTSLEVKKDFCSWVTSVHLSVHLEKLAFSVNLQLPFSVTLRTPVCRPVSSQDWHMSEMGCPPMSVPSSPHQGLFRTRSSWWSSVPASWRTTPTKPKWRKFWLISRWGLKSLLPKWWASCVARILWVNPNKQSLSYFFRRSSVRCSTVPPQSVAL